MSVLHHQITAPNETAKREFYAIARVIIRWNDYVATALFFGTIGRIYVGVEIKSHISGHYRRQKRLTIHTRKNKQTNILSLAFDGDREILSIA